MQSYGRSSLYEFLGDFVVYRNLAPVDARLPALADLAPRAGLPPNVIPRKSQPEYGAVMALLLQEAQALHAPGRPIERLFFVGDTRLNDGTAFAAIGRAGGWPGLGFIGADRPAPPQTEIVDQQGAALFVANRWTALADFDRYAAAQGLPIDERSAVVVDIDKTALGARGRNDHTIDEARVEAVRRTVGSLLGRSYDPERFQSAYDRLNQPEFHRFTADNQDYLAYICLVLGDGLFDLEPLVARVQRGEMASFEQFIADVDGRAAQLSAGLRPIHAQIFALVRQGDPTPFKAFRINEYQTTVAKMGCLDDDAPVERLLRDELVITQEVRAASLMWRERGALLFGLSDKPDEASTPSAEWAARGYQPIHRTETHIVGM